MKRMSQLFGRLFGNLFGGQFATRVARPAVADDAGVAVADDAGTRDAGIAVAGDAGAAAVEYALIVGLIAVVVIAGVTMLGQNLGHTFDRVATVLPTP